MKNRFFIAAATVAALFASCDKNDTPMNPAQPGMPDGACLLYTSDAADEL